MWGDRRRGGGWGCGGKGGGGWEKSVSELWGCEGCCDGGSFFE